jgi:hypothetical protein
MKLWWYSAANILYAFGSLGYLAINIANLIDRTTVELPATYIILVILAILFLIDALLYTADWVEQRSTKKRRELIGCILNVIGSILYLIGATVFQNNSTSTTNLSDIPSFVFNILGMLAFLAESILSFCMPRVTKKTSKCSVEFFANLLNLIGNIIYLTAHIVQPIITFIASFTTQLLNNLTDTIFLIIRPIQIGGDIIYTIDAVLYIIVWLKANEQMRKIGATWIERGNTTLSKITKKTKINATIPEQLPEPRIDNTEPVSKDLPIQTISKQIPETIVVEDVEPSTEKESAET